MKRFTVLFAALLLLMLGACGSPSTSPVGPASASASTQEPISSESASNSEPVTEPMKIGFCAGGKLGDKSTNDLHHEALKKFSEETGAILTVIEGSNVEDHEVNARNFAEQGYDLVVLGSTSVSDQVATFAPEYPDTFFWVNQGVIDNMPNVACTRSMPSESNFLTGAFAIYMSEAMGYPLTAGWIGGLRSPALERAQYGFTAGVQYAGGEASVAYIGNFTDTATAKEMTLQMYNKGIHFVQGWCGGAIVGIMQAAESRYQDEYYCLAGGGPEGDFYRSPDAIIACAVEGGDALVYDMVTKFYNGTLSPGITYAGVKDEIIDILLSPYAPGEKIPQEVKDKIQALRDKIISGELVPPQNEDTYNIFKTEVLDKSGR